MNWLPATTIVAPQGFVVSLETAKQYLRIDVDDASLDDQVAIWIGAAVAQIESITGTRLLTQTVEVRADCFSWLDALPIGPVQSVTQIRYIDRDGAEQIVDEGSYETIGSGLDFGIRTTVDSQWPAVRSGRGNITVRAVVGYGNAEDMPRELFLAVLNLIRAAQDDEPGMVDHLLVNHRFWL